ncbi:hypothetical protein [Streptomyces chartreusis]|uniref:hypothetical protein n=1 Tax=Streptomyces chartreusis TaxID=1969 RepID=UPI003691B74C
MVQRLDPAEFEIATLVPTVWITHLQRLGGSAQDRSVTASADFGLTLDDVLDLRTGRDLGDAKIEILSECKLKYPQDYAPDGIRSMNDEVEQLHQLRTRLIDLQARREAESPLEETAMP